MRPRARSIRKLEATRLGGVALLGVLAQFAVAMPGGYFGPADATTTFGAAYSALALVLGAVGAYAHLEGRAWAGGFALLYYSATIGVFVPALQSDPVRAAALIAWLLLGAARQLFPYRGDDALPDDPVAAWRAEWGAAATQLILVSIIATASVVGFRLTATATAQTVCLALNVACSGMTAPFLLRLVRDRSKLALAIPVAWALAVGLWVTGQHGAAFIAIGLTQLVTLGLLWAGERVTDELLTYFYVHPALLTCLSFAAIILVGTLLLSFPAAAADGVRIAPIDALFTATSATCVTGLTVVDTAKAYSTWGHVVILGLIQVGGLNIMVLSTFAALALGRRLGLRGELALGQVLDLPMHRTAYQVTQFIVSATLAIEGVGAALLALCHSRSGDDVVEASWHGTFHAVSAFCNAGFALRSDNVVLFQRDPFALAVIGSLVVLGGLGFTVLATAWLRLRGERAPLPLQVKLVLVVSAALIVAGTALYAVVEWDASLRGLPAAHKLTNAAFQSVITRTAGFNSVDVTLMRPGTILVCCVLMVIGASPGSTGGGIKTTTFAVLVGTVISAVRGGAPIVLFRRTIPGGLAYRSAAVLVATLAIASLGLFALLLTQESPFERLLFEVCSAIGTVGLSLGATAQLDVAGKAIVALLMFAGRVGPLTLVLLLGNPVQARLGYPDAKLMIG
jgi:trk system potassium uptake protein